MEQSQLVQRAVQRLRDGITRREMNFDLDAIKAVLVEMATQKERADRLERELVEVRADRSHQRSLAESRYTDWRKLLDEKRGLETELHNALAALEAVRKDMHHYQDRCIAYQIEAQKAKGGA
jgi:predicted  nucleic acid-binding Zn-ribbon protein